MDKIKKFKKEVLTLKIYSQKNYYPGNPFYIGKLEDERLKKSIEESSYKFFISKKNKKLYNEITSNEPISQYYVELVDETDLFDIYEEALHSTDDFSIDDLKVALDLLEAYKYDSFLEELDLLQDKFLKVETTKKDEKCFKAMCRKQFGYSIPKDGKITTVFVNSLQSEMKKRVDYLETLKDMIEKVIEIKEFTEACALSKAVGLQSLPINDSTIQSLIDCNIERRQVKPLFEFIDFLYFNRAEFVEYNGFVGEYEQLKAERESIALMTNYKAQKAKEEIDHKIEAQKILMHANITEHIKHEAEYLRIYDVLEYDYVREDEVYLMSGINAQKENCSVDAFKLIKLYEDRYVEFREATMYNQYDCNDLFEGVDNLLEDLFSFVHEDDLSNLKVSKEKYFQCTKTSLIESSTENSFQPAENKVFTNRFVSDNEVQQSTSLSPLFSFVAFLYENIDNFNHYNDVILELNKELEIFYKLGTPFINNEEKKAHRSKIDGMWDIVFTNIVNPIRDKVAELSLFDWHTPETLLNNHINISDELRKSHNNKGLGAVLKAKNQHVEFTDKINPNVTEQAESTFKYLNEVMTVVVDYLKNVDEKIIEDIEDNEVNSFARLDSSTETHNYDTLFRISGSVLNIDYDKITTSLMVYRDNPATMKTLCKTQCVSARDIFYVSEEDFYKHFFKFTTQKKQLLKHQRDLLEEEDIGPFLAIKSSLDDYETIELLEQFINQLRFEENKQETESLKALNSNTTFPECIKRLFYLIEFVSANLSHFKNYDITLKELNSLELKKKQLGPIENYQDKLRELEIEKRYKEKRNEIDINIIGPIIIKAKSLELYTSNNLNLIWHISSEGIEKLKSNPPVDDIWLIQNYEDKYINCKRELIIDNYSAHFFSDLDKTLAHLFSFFRDKQEEKLIEQTDDAEIANQLNNEDTMDINYEAIFEIALTYTDDPAEMKEFCIREQKKADRDYFYNKDTFYKGLLKVVLKEKERAKPTTNPQPATMRIGSMFVAGTGGSPYSYRDIERLEGVVFQLLNEDVVPQEEEATHETSQIKNILQPSGVAKPAKELKPTENKTKKRKSGKKIKERVINSELLGQYFKNSFHGMGDNPVNYFHMLVNELKTQRTGKQYGEIALMIYNSEHVNNRMPREFNKWFIIFCECIDIKKPTYKRGVLGNPAYNLKHLFNYL